MIEVEAVSQFVDMGALGVLALVVYLGFRLINKHADAMSQSLNRQATAMEQVLPAIEQFSSLSKRRHKALMAHIDERAQETMESIRMTMNGRAPHDEHDEVD